MGNGRRVGVERNGVGVKRRIRHEVITCHREDVRVRNKMSKKGSMELAAKDIVTKGCGNED